LFLHKCGPHLVLDAALVAEVCEAPLELVRDAQALQQNHLELVRVSKNKNHKGPNIHVRQDVLVCADGQVKTFNARFLDSHKTCKVHAKLFVFISLGW
jgi:hypothetical protein